MLLPILIWCCFFLSACKCSEAVKQTDCKLLELLFSNRATLFRRFINLRFIRMYAVSYFLLSIYTKYNSSDHISTDVWIHMCWLNSLAGYFLLVRLRTIPSTQLTWSLLFVGKFDNDSDLRACALHILYFPYDILYFFYKNYYEHIIYTFHCLRFVIIRCWQMVNTACCQKNPHRPYHKMNISICCTWVLVYKVQPKVLLRWQNQKNISILCLFKNWLKRWWTHSHIKEEKKLVWYSCEFDS